MWGVAVNDSTNTSEQISNVYNEAQKYTDQSVKDTMIQNYITNITTRNEDITELVKNFENNVSAAAESVQRNTTKFGACIDLDGANINQVNELKQDVKQGFQKLNEDVKVLKKVLETESDTSTTAEQVATETQGSSSTTEQKAEQEQKSKQETEQKATFTALNSFNKYLSGRGKEMFSSFLPSLPSSPFKRKNPSITIREHFDTLMNGKRREPFCLFMCADVNNSKQSSTQISNSTNIDLQTNLQTQDIYKKIDTAYDKTVETINKISEAINETTNSIASASSVQINEFIIETPADACRLNLKNLDVNQQNKLEQQVELSTAIQSINSLTTDTEIKAIMSDMMGLTQASDTKQEAKTDTKQTTEQKQSNDQLTAQTAGSDYSRLITIIVIVLLVGGAFFGFMKSRKNVDSYFDGESNGDETTTTSTATTTTTSKGGRRMRW